MSTMMAVLSHHSTVAHTCITAPPAACPHTSHHMLQPNSKCSLRASRRTLTSRAAEVRRHTHNTAVPHTCSHSSSSVAVVRSSSSDHSQVQTDTLAACTSIQILALASCNNILTHSHAPSLLSLMHDGACSGCMAPSAKPTIAPVHPDYL